MMGLSRGVLLTRLVRAMPGDDFNSIEHNIGCNLAYSCPFFLFSLIFLPVKFVVFLEFLLVLFSDLAVVSVMMMIPYRK